MPFDVKGIREVAFRRVKVGSHCYMVREKVNVLSHGYGYGRENDCAQVYVHGRRAILKANADARSTSPASIPSVCSQDILDPGTETMESGSASGHAHGRGGYGSWLTLEEHRKKPLSVPQRNCWSRKARANLGTSFICSLRNCCCCCCLAPS